MTADLMWSEASADREAQDKNERMARAKVAAATLWPFLSLSKSAAEFDHRIALVADRMNETVPSDLYDGVVASLREDFVSVTAADYNGWKEESQKERQEKLENSQPKGEGDEGGPVPHDTFSAGSNSKNAATGELWDDDYGHRQETQQQSQPDRLRDHFGTDGSGSYGRNAEGDHYYSVSHPSGFQARSHAAGDNLANHIAITHAATGDIEHDEVNLKRPVADENDLKHELRKWVDGGHGNWLAQNNDFIRRHMQEKHQAAKSQTFQFWHEGARRWVTASPADSSTGTNENPYYNRGIPEQGPNTESDGQYANFPAGPDPVDPINGQYPMQPSSWGENGGWHTNDMHLMPGATNYKQSSTNEKGQRNHLNEDDMKNMSLSELRNSLKDLPAGHPVHQQVTKHLNDRDPVDEYGFNKSVKDEVNSWGMWPDSPDNPRNKESARRQAAGRYTDEGVETGHGPNPYFFSGGDEGVSGAGGERYPADPGIDGNPEAGGELSESPNAEPIESWLERYDHMGPSSLSNGPGVEMVGSFSAQAATLGGRHPFVADGGMSGGGMGMNPAPGMGMDAPSATGGAPPQAGSDPNVPQEASSPQDMGNMGGAAKASSRRQAVGEPPSESGGGMSPSPPPSMTGGPGSTAMPPMAPGGGNTPQTTPPATQPGGAGAGTDMAGMAPGGANVPQSPAQGVVGSFSRQAAELNRNVESPDDPTGLGDEFTERTVQHALEQRPRQPGEHRNVNTPQNPSGRAPIQTTTSPGLAGQDDEEERV